MKILLLFILLLINCSSYAHNKNNFLLKIETISHETFLGCVNESNLNDYVPLSNCLDSIHQFKSNSNPNALSKLTFPSFAQLCLLDLHINNSPILKSSSEFIHVYHGHYKDATIELKSSFTTKTIKSVPTSIITIAKEELLYFLFDFVGEDKKINSHYTHNIVGLIHFIPPFIYDLSILISKIFYPSNQKTETYQVNFKSQTDYNIKTETFQIKYIVQHEIENFIEKNNNVYYSLNNFYAFDNWFNGFDAKVEFSKIEKELAK